MLIRQIAFSIPCCKKFFAWLILCFQNKSFKPIFPCNYSTKKPTCSATNNNYIKQIFHFFLPFILSLFYKKRINIANNIMQRNKFVVFLCQTLDNATFK